VLGPNTEQTIELSTPVLLDAPGVQLGAEFGVRGLKLLVLLPEVVDRAEVPGYLADRPDDVGDGRLGWAEHIPGGGTKRVHRRRRTAAGIERDHGERSEQE
jgi:hypothetical protein